MFLTSILCMWNITLRRFEYQFNLTSLGLFKCLLFIVSERRETRVLAPNSTTCYDIPVTDICPFSLGVLWPKYFDSEESCFCNVYNSSAGRMIFEKCSCFSDGTADIVPHFSENGSICFSDQNSNLNGTAVHFQCVTDPCQFEDCFIRTIISTYRIIISGIKYI